MDGDLKIRRSTRPNFFRNEDKKRLPPFASSSDFTPLPSPLNRNLFPSHKSATLVNVKHSTPNNAQSTKTLSRNISFEKLFSPLPIIRTPMKKKTVPMNAIPASSFDMMELPRPSKAVTRGVETTSNLSSFLLTKQSNIEPLEFVVQRKPTSSPMKNKSFKKNKPNEAPVKLTPFVAETNLMLTNGLTDTCSHLFNNIITNQSNPVKTAISEKIPDVNKSMSSKKNQNCVDDFYGFEKSYGQSKSRFLIPPAKTPNELRNLLNCVSKSAETRISKSSVVDATHDATSSKRSLRISNTPITRPEGGHSRSVSSFSFFNKPVTEQSSNSSENPFSKNEYHFQKRSVELKNQTNVDLNSNYTRIFPSYVFSSKFMPSNDNFGRNRSVKRTPMESSNATAKTDGNYFNRFLYRNHFDGNVVDFRSKHEHFENCKDDGRTPENSSRLGVVKGPKYDVFNLSLASNQLPIAFVAVGDSKNKTLIPVFQDQSIVSEDHDREMYGSSSRSRSEDEACRFEYLLNTKISKLTLKETTRNKNYKVRSNIFASTKICEKAKVKPVNRKMVSAVKKSQKGNKIVSQSSPSMLSPERISKIKLAKGVDTNASNCNKNKRGSSSQNSTQKVVTSSTEKFSLRSSTNKKDLKITTNQIESENKVSKTQRERRPRASQKDDPSKKETEKRPLRNPKDSSVSKKIHLSSVDEDDFMNLD